MTIHTHLIENALNLTGTPMADVMENIGNYHKNSEGLETYEYGFSIEKFCFYLLSPEFIHNYHTPSTYEEGAPEFEWIMKVQEFGQAIYEYQKGNPGPLIDLLTKIPGKHSHE